MKEEVLGVKVDYVTIDQALETTEKWLEKRGSHYIVTPNPEMVIDSEYDTSFKTSLDKADLAIPDSPRMGWASKVLTIKNRFLRLFYLPYALFPKLISGNDYKVVTGVDLTEKLIRLSEEKGYITAYLGGSEKVADQLFECLKVKYPKLKIAFCSGNIQIGKNGEMRFDAFNNKKTVSKSIRYSQPLNPHILAERIDIMFVAFGHGKQEKWIYKNLPRLKTRVMVGVGGAFDYLSGSVPRAPRFMRILGFEWLFRVIVQPWRIKRFWKLPVFVYKVMTSK
jgi:N-acetylglucosaminyldiphosphoundecaprenol N-acetyl-beta-D-mannosaminyltransferase